MFKEIDVYFAVIVPKSGKGLHADNTRNLTDPAGFCFLESDLHVLICIRWACVSATNTGVCALWMQSVTISSLCVRSYIVVFVRCKYAKGLCDEARLFFRKPLGNERSTRILQRETE